MNDFKLTPKQLEAQALITGDAMHYLLRGGARSAKTFFLVRAVIMRALCAPGSRHLMARFRFNHIKASLISDTFPKVMLTCFINEPYDLDKSDWFVRFQNGSEIWFGGLDDKDRTEKILGQEYVTIFLNEISQIPFSSRNLALTRLAQKVNFLKKDAESGEVTEGSMRPRMYYDCNPPAKNHWSYKMFFEKKDPDSNKLLDDPENYESLLMNPMDNLQNLPESYIKTLESMPKRLRTRFLEGRFTEVNENALWSMETLDRNRSSEPPEWQRVIIAVDPSGAKDDDNESNDAIGIVVAALGTDGFGYLVEDLTIKAGPKTWGNIVVQAFERHNADKVVAEGNYGGAMVEHVIQTARRNTPFELVTATRGKVVRAEPIASLHEQGKIKFVGQFDDLENELLSFTTTGYGGERSPNRADAFIWAMSEIFPGMVRDRKHGWSGTVVMNSDFNPLGA